MSETDPGLIEAARRIKLLILDVDGVLTDGRVYLAPNGDVTKRFDIRDGHVLVLMRKVPAPPSGRKPRTGWCE